MSSGLDVHVVTDGTVEGTRILNRIRARRTKASIGLVSAVLLTLASFVVQKIQTGEWLWAWPEQALTNIRPELGLAYIASTGRPDLSSHERFSSAVVLEDGRVLGPPNAQHADIRSAGRGRFSFWHDYVYLSASDTTDPRTNGRRYTFRHPPIGSRTANALYLVTLLVDLGAVMIFALGAAPAGRIAKRGVVRLAERLKGMRFTRSREGDRPSAMPRTRGSVLYNLRDVSRVVAVSGGHAVRDAIRQLRAVEISHVALAMTGGLLAATIVAAMIEPVRALATASEAITLIVTVTIVFAVGYLAGVAVVPYPKPIPSAPDSPPTRSMRAPRARVLAQIVTLLGLGIFVWLRPGVGNLPLLPVAVQLTVLLLVAGLVVHFVLPGRVRDGVARWCERPGSPSGAIVTGLCVLLALPLLALPVAQHWDSSGFMDSHSYDTYAINIATGKTLVGDSQYMPAYQYGLAFVYYFWGHFFFLQQIVNIILACIGIASLCWAGWILFRSAAAVLVIGILLGMSRPLQYAIHFTQIESWYLPLVCVLLLTWSRYWRSASWTTAIGLAVAVSVGMNMRNQGAPFFAFMCLAPLVVAGLTWRRRVAHLVVIGAVVAASLIPWTIRNYVVEGRLSPSASRSTLYLGTLNDHRIGLYGIRYWDGWNEVAAEFNQRYPNAAERERALVRAMWSNLVADPGWLARAMYWRVAAFYGLLPNGTLAIDRIIPTDWATEWPSYIFWRTAPVVILPLSLLGLALRPGRTALFLTGAILANLSIMLVSATSEDRLSYPVLPLHILIAASIFATRQEAPRLATASATRRGRFAVPAAAALVVFLAVSRTQIGSQYIYRPLIERDLKVTSAVDLDPDLPLLDAGNTSGVNGAVEPVPTNLGRGQRVRILGMLTNYMYPPKFAGAVGWVPSFATDPVGPTFYYLAGMGPDGTRVGTRFAVGVTFRGAQISEPLREGDAVEVAGEVLQDDRQGPSGLWLRALLIKKLPISADRLPPFP
ncbi:MAG TPA: hypothetical protein VGJ78_15240 [Vicinamibacterales bacterium]